MKRKEIAEQIVSKLKLGENEYSKEFRLNSEGIGYFVVDDLLDPTLANKCNELFPASNEMKFLNTFRERKYVSAQMDRHNNLLEDVLYAFQSPEVIKAVSKICNIPDLEADDILYAGGLSLMNKDCFLNPHLDNSHNAEIKKWRVLNALYYVSPNWNKDYGGNLELWPNSISKNPIEIVSKFNRLVVMATHYKSWHSVNKVQIDASRKCISNYYFSNYPLTEKDKFHVTIFNGRPNEIFKSVVLKTDAFLRMTLRKIFKNGIRRNPHYYKKSEEKQK